MTSRHHELPPAADELAVVAACAGLVIVAALSFHGTVVAGTAAPGQSTVSHPAPVSVTGSSGHNEVTAAVPAELRVRPVPVTADRAPARARHLTIWLCDVPWPVAWASCPGHSSAADPSGATSTSVVVAEPGGMAGSTVRERRVTRTGHGRSGAGAHPVTSTRA